MLFELRLAVARMTEHITLVDSRHPDGVQGAGRGNRRASHEGVRRVVIGARAEARHFGLVATSPAAGTP